MPSLRSLAASAAVLVSTATALVLQELPHNDGLRYSKRGDPLGCLDLKSEESFLWGAADETQAALGNLTVYMPDTQENILSMERFNDMLTDVTCTQSSIDMTFRDDDTFAYAKAVWDWVNGEENCAFIMVAGKGACGWNEDHRQPFRVTTLSFDEAGNVAHLAAEALEWAQAIHTYTLNVGGLPSHDLEKRQFGSIDYNKDLNIDFNHQFPIETVSLPLPDGATAVLDLSNCSTAGAFAFQFRLETIFLIPTKAEMSVHPQGVSLTVAPSLTLTGNITEPRTADLTLARINLAGIQIPAGILDIGPEIVLSVGATVGPLQGEASVTAGVVYSLDDNAVASVDVMGFEAQQSGWTPNVQTTPLTVEAELDGYVKAFVKAELELAAKAFGTGFDLGIGLAPFIAADLQTVTAESGACGASDGLALNPSYGVDLILDAHTPFNGEDDPLFEITLFSLEQPLPNSCLPFGNSDVVPAKVSSAPLSPSSSSTPALQPSSPSALPVVASVSSVSAPISSAQAVSSAYAGASTLPVYAASVSADAASPSSSSAADVVYGGYGAAYANAASPAASSATAPVYGGYAAAYTSSAAAPIYAAASTLSTVVASSSSSSITVAAAEATPPSVPQYGGYGYGRPRNGYGGY